MWDRQEFVLSPLTSISYGMIAPQNRADSKTSLKRSVCVEGCFTVIKIHAYVLKDLTYEWGAEIPWGIALLLTSAGAGYLCMLWAMMHSSEVSKLPVSHWILTRNLFRATWKGEWAKVMFADSRPRKRTKFQFHCSDFMLSHNCRAPFPAYKLKSSLQYIFASIITHPCNSILTVFYTVC